MNITVSALEEKCQVYISLSPSNFVWPLTKISQQLQDRKENIYRNIFYCFIPTMHSSLFPFFLFSAYFPLFSIYMFPSFSHSFLSVSLSFSFLYMYASLCFPSINIFLVSSICLSASSEYVSLVYISDMLW